MKTKIDLEEVKSGKIKYNDYLKEVSKDYGRTQTGKAEDCLLIGKFDFKDKSSRPLLVLGVSSEWKAFIKEEIRNNKYAASGICTPSENGLDIELKKGKLSDSLAEKQLKKHPPLQDVEITLKNSAGTEEDIDKATLQEKSGFKLSGSTTYAKIKQELDAFKALHAADYSARLESVETIIALGKTWAEKHGKSEKEVDKKKGKELVALLNKLLNVRQKLLAKMASDEASMQDELEDIQSGIIRVARMGDNYILSRTLLQQLLQDMAKWDGLFKENFPKEAKEVARLRALVEEAQEENEEAIANSNEEDMKARLKDIQKRVSQIMESEQNYFVVREELLDIADSIEAWRQLYAKYYEAEADYLDSIDPFLEECYAQNEAKVNSGMVVSLDPKDKVIKKATKDIHEKRKLSEDRQLRLEGTDEERFAQQDALGYERQFLKKDQKLNFEESGKDAPIVLLAHGSPIYPDKAPSSGVYASHFGDKKPKAIVDFLIKRKLNKNYAGIIYLDGCYTASGLTGGPNFAKDVYDLLVKKGYLYLQVKGNLGAAKTTDDGKELVEFAPLEKRLERVTKEIADFKKQKKKLIAAFAEKRRELEQENGISTLEEQVRAANQACLKASSEKTNNQDPEKAEALAEALEKAKTKLEEVKAELKKKKQALSPTLAKLAEAEGKLWDEIHQKQKAAEEELKGMDIIALTGTFGPEKLPKR